MKKRRCINCGEPIVGRADKRYCDDNCRSAYNNNRNSIPNTFMRKVNETLKQNRRVLGEMLGGEKMKKVSREKLLSKGLDFDFFTSQLSNAKGQVYFFVYEYGYLSLDEELFLIVRQRISEKR